MIGLFLFFSYFLLAKRRRNKLGQSAKGQKSRKFRAIGYRGQRFLPWKGGILEARRGREEEPPIRGQLLNFITPCRPSPLALRVREGWRREA